MSWYYYSGRVVRSIPVGNGRSVAMRPNTKIEILEVSREVQALLAQGVLRRTGRPPGAPSLADAPPRSTVRLQDVLPKSSLAQHFAEKGVTTSKDIPPRKPVGKPEFTIHEMESAGAVFDGLQDAVRGDTPTPMPAADVLPAADAADEGSNRTKRRRGH